MFALDKDALLRWDGRDGGNERLEILGLGGQAGGHVLCYAVDGADGRGKGVVGINWVGILDAGLESGGRAGKFGCFGLVGVGWRGDVYFWCVLIVGAVSGVEGYGVVEGGCGAVAVRQDLAHLDCWWDVKVTRHIAEGER